jgi:hypothetical protein
MRTARLLVVAGITLQTVVLPAVVDAQCVVFEQPEDLFARADVVFAGTVVATESTGARGDHSIVQIATLRVDKAWKGSLTREVRVGADRPFEVEKKYVVFAAGKPLSTSILCRWAEPQDPAKTQLEWLAAYAGVLQGAAAGQSAGGWSARSSTGRTLKGTWTAVADPKTGTVTGTWTLDNAKGTTVTRGGWSAAKSPSGWTGAWRAAVSGSKGEYSGTWSASVKLKADAPFADLFKMAAHAVVSGNWRAGRHSGAWSIRAFGGEGHR